MWSSVLGESSACSDCIAFSPSGEHFVVGTYQLNEQTSLREGSLLLYQTKRDSNGDCLSALPISDFPRSSGVFSFSWLNSHLEALLASNCVYSLASGIVEMCYIHNNDEEIVPHIDLIRSFPLPVEDSTSTICTDCDICRSGSKLLASDTSGKLHIFSIHDSTTSNLDRSWRAHDLEIWTCAWSPWEDHIFWSGGDDASWCQWDSRVESWTHCDTKSHREGVCCVEPSPHDPFVVATGSYDDHIRIWDLRYLQKPSSSFFVGGGVWQVSWHPFFGSIVGCAGMYSGFHVLDTASFSDHCTQHTSEVESDVHDCRIWNFSGNDASGEESHSKEISRESDILAYGVDWHPVFHDVIGCCSFYDKRISLHRLDLTAVDRSKEN